MGECMEHFDPMRFGFSAPSRLSRGCSSYPACRGVPALARQSRIDSFFWAAHDFCRACDSALREDGRYGITSRMLRKNEGTP